MLIATAESLHTITQFDGLPGSNLGIRLSSPGDLNGDARSDLVASFSGYSSLGEHFELRPSGDFWPTPTIPTNGGPAPMFRGDPAHTGRSAQMGPLTGALAWSTALGLRVDSTPVVDSQENIYVIVDGILRARWVDGSERWSATGYNLLLTTTALGRTGTLYAVDVFGDLVALDKATGTVLWRFHPSGPIGSGLTVGSDGTIYFTASRLFGLAGQVVAVNPGGTERWHFDTSSPVHTTPAIAPDGSVYFATFGKRVQALHANGTSKWYRDFGIFTFALSTPAIGSDGTLYIGSIGNRIYALNGATGATRWSFQAGEISSPAIAIDGSIYVGSVDTRLYALAPDGAVRWSYKTGGPIVSSPLLDARGTVYFGSNDGKLYAISSATGTLIFSTALGGAVQSSPVLGNDGILYVGSVSGHLRAIGN